MVKETAIVILVSTALLLTACDTTPTPEPAASAPVPGPVVPIGEPEVRDLGPSTETVWNCGSGGGTVVKHPSMSVVTSHAVEWEVGGTIGMGAKIGEGAIPAGVDLSGSLEGHYVTQIDESIQQGTAWDLPAEPDTIVEYTLLWREVWQPGYVEVRLVDQSVIRVNVRYRTGIQSEIVGKLVQDCEQTITPPLFTATLAQTSIPPTETLIPPTNTPLPSCSSGLICYEADFSELDPKLWCKIPPNQLVAGQLLITATGLTEDVRYELQPCEGLGRGLRFIELTMKITATDGPPGNAHAGIQADAGNNAYFFFSLDSGGNGYLDPGISGQDERFPLEDFSATHVLRVEWTGHEVFFYIDDSQPKTRLTTEGFGNWLLLHVTAYKGASITAEFDDVRWGVAPP